MYSYYVIFKNGKIFYITNHKIEGEYILLFDYTRKGKKYNLNDIDKIIESRIFMGKKTEKIIYNSKEVV